MPSASLGIILNTFEYGVTMSNVQTYLTVALLVALCAPLAHANPVPDPRHAQSLFVSLPLALLAEAYVVAFLLRSRIKKLIAFRCIYLIITSITFLFFIVLPLHGSPYRVLGFHFPHWYSVPLAELFIYGVETTCVIIYVVVTHTRVTRSFVMLILLSVLAGNAVSFFGNNILKACLFPLLGLL